MKKLLLFPVAFFVNNIHQDIRIWLILHDVRFVYSAFGLHVLTTNSNISDEHAISRLKNGASGFQIIARFAVRSTCRGFSACFLVRELSCCLSFLTYSVCVLAAKTSGLNPKNASIADENDVKTSKMKASTRCCHEMWDCMHAQVIIRMCAFQSLFLDSSKVLSI